jgi:hypothetical protein
VAAVEWHSALDRELPIEKCRSFITIWDQTIVETDDPRWIDCELTVCRCHSAETKAACALISCRQCWPAWWRCCDTRLMPTRLGKDGRRWWKRMTVRPRSWRHILLANLAEILPELAPVTA